MVEIGDFKIWVHQCSDPYCQGRMHIIHSPSGKDVSVERNWWPSELDRRWKVWECNLNTSIPREIYDRAVRFMNTV